MRYAVLTADKVEQLYFNEVVEDSVDTLRWNNDLTKTLIKFREPTPSVVEEDDVLTRKQISEILDGPEWAPDSP